MTRSVCCSIVNDAAFRPEPQRAKSPEITRGDGVTTDFGIAEPSVEGDLS